MPTLCTLGNPETSIQFTYSGSVNVGVVLHLPEKPRITAKFFWKILYQFEDRTVRLAFKSTEPEAKGLAEWVRVNSPRLNIDPLTREHAEYIAAIMDAEGYAMVAYRKQEPGQVYLRF